MNSIIPPKEFSYLFSIRTSCRIKVFDTHPSKPWVCYSTQNNVVQIWDYNLKTCIKSLYEVKLESGEIIDLQKNFEVKTLRFYDKNVIFWMFPNTSNKTEEEEQKINNFQRNWVIIQGEQKVIFYDYTSDTAQMISPLQLEQKTVKCLEILDDQYLAVGCSDGSIKIFDIKLWQFPKTMKGHPKNINFMLTHKQNEGNRPRVIVSTIDGQLACWNVDTNTEEPAFKFNMIKKSRNIQTSNDGQEIIGMCLDPYQHRLITITEDYITVWSSLAGTEIKRFKNVKGSSIKGIQHLNHPSFQSNTFLVHSKDSELYLIDVEEQTNMTDNHNKLPIIQFKPFYDLKDNQEIDRRIQILAVKMNYINPTLIFIGTSHGYFIISINSFVTPNIAFNFMYTSNLKVEQTKEFVKSTGEHKKFGQEEKNKLKVMEETQNQIVNFMYLSSSGPFIQCFLFDSAKQGQNQLQVKSNIYQFNSFNFSIEDCEIKCSLSAKYISIRSRENGYFEILKVDNSQIYDDQITGLSLSGESREETLHFLSKLNKIHSGLAIDLVWHQYRDEFAVLSPLGKKNSFVELIEKTQTVSTGSFFSKKSYQVYQYEYSEQIQKISVCLYTLEGNSQAKPQIIFIEDKFLNPTKLFGNGEIYCVSDLSMEQDITEMLKVPNSRRVEAFRMHKFNKVEFFDIDRSKNKYKKIGKLLIEPKLIFWSLSNEICIVVYNNFFSVFRYFQESEQLQFFKTMNYKVIDGYFWENIFFFSNEKSVNIAILDFFEEILVMELAALEVKVKKKYIFDFEEIFGNDPSEIIYDTIYPELQKKPPGQLKIMTIYDSKLVVINQNQELGYIDLSHPFIKFCMYLQHQKFDQCLEVTKQFDPITHYIFAEMFIYHQAYQELNQMSDLNLIDKSIIQLKYFNKIELAYIQQIFQMNKFSLEQKQQLLSYFMSTLYSQGNQQQVDELYSIAITYNIPVIGIYTQPTQESWGEEFSPEKYNYIAASYVKFIEMAGARVVPINWDMETEQLKDIFEQINGILFTGGATELKDDQMKPSLYSQNAHFLLNLAIEANNNNDFFPIWGTCLGFEMIGYIMSNSTYENVISEVGKDNNITHTINLQNIEKSEMMQALSLIQLEDIQNKDTVYYYHHEGILPETMEKNINLKQNFLLLGWSQTQEGVIYTAAYEGRKYPIYATQFHPEKSPFEWKVNANHQLYAIEITQKWANFFVQKSRQNFHLFESEQSLQNLLIYNFTPIQIEKSSYMQCYIFPKSEQILIKSQDQQIEI